MTGVATTNAAAAVDIGVPPQPTSDTKAVLALARVESVRLLRSTAFLVGVVLGALALLAAGREATRLDAELAVGTVPLAWATLIATNLAMLRSRRNATQELLDTKPVTMTQRTLAHLISCLVTAPVTAVLILGYFVYPLAVGDDVGPLHASELSIGVLLVIGGGIVGIAVARWLPHPAFSVPAIIATSVIQGNTASVWDTASRFGLLTFWTQTANAGLGELMVRRAGWHMLWIIAWIVMMGLVALARDGLSTAVVVAGTLALAVIGLAAWGQIRAIPAEDADAMVEILEDPGAFQVCNERDAIEICAYEEYAEFIGSWHTTVSKVLDRIPASTGGDKVLVTQRANQVVGDTDCEPVPFADTLQGEVAQRISAEAVWPRDGIIHPALVAEDACGDGGGPLHLAIQTGAYAMGLPPNAAGTGRRCVADHEARSVAALWLGAQAVPRGAGGLGLIVDTADTDASGRLDFAGWSTPPVWGVDWNAADLDAARALLALSPTRVAETLGRDWDRWTDPATPASDLLAAAGVPNATDPAQIEDTCGTTGG